MKRGLIGTFLVALAVAVLTLGISALNVATAQETPEKEQEVDRRVVRIVEPGAGGSYLGVRIDDVDEEEANRLGLSDVHGVLVSEVMEDTPAAEAGLQEDDVLVSWNGVRLESAAQLQRHMRETPAGRSVRIGVVRDGTAREVSVTLGEREGMSGVFVSPEMGRAHAFRFSPENQERLKERMGDLKVRMEELRERMGPEGEAIRRYAVAVGGRGRLGVSIQNLGDQLADYFGVEDGALITSVLEDSPAERAGLQAGDVIVGIGDADVEDPGDVMRALAEREAGPVSVRVVRERQPRSVTVELEERQSGMFCSGDDCEEWEAHWKEFGEEWAKSIEDWAEGLEHMEWITPHGDGVIRLEGMHLDPLLMEGVHIDPIEVHLEGLTGGEDFMIPLPSIDVPAFEIPAFDVPAPDVPVFDLPAYTLPGGDVVIEV